MQVGRFKKVSYDVFAAEMKREEWFFYKEADIKSMYDNIQLPTRATSGSAGYDFKSPFDFALGPGDTMYIPTGIRVHIDDGWFLGLFPRSGFGFKYRIQLDNTVGIIDSDYYYSDNEGHIILQLTYDKKSGDVLFVDEGQAIVQGIFLPYGITYGDEANGVRKGGFGSTDRPTLC